MSNFFVPILLPFIILIGVHGRGLNQPPILTPLVNSNSNESIIYKTNDLQGKDHCSAVLQTGPNMKYYGGRVQVTLYDPRAQDDQWSSYRIKVSIGVHSIEAGLIVKPSYFKDNQAHFYVYTNAGPKACFNLDCPGYVVVDHRLPLGFIPESYSTVGGVQFGWTISIEKNSKDSHWWVYASKDSIGLDPIGFWSIKALPNLAGAATQVSWGGEIGNPNKIVPVPTMGSGLPARDKYAAFFRHILVKDNTFHNVNPVGTETFSDCPDSYSIIDKGDVGEDFGRLITYGG